MDMNDNSMDEGLAYIPFRSASREHSIQLESNLFTDTSLDSGNDLPSQSSHLVLIKAIARFVGLNKESTDSSHEDQIEYHSSLASEPSHSSLAATSHTTTSSQSRISSKFTSLLKISDKHLFILHPTGIGVLYWNVIITFAVAYNLFFIPIRTAFPYVQERYLPFWYFLDYFSDGYYLLDIIVQLRISHLEQGCLVDNWKAMAHYYVFSKRFVLDLLSMLPLGILSISSHLTIYHNYSVFLRFIRLVKAYKIRILVERIEGRSDHPNVIRIVTLVMILMVITHINACLYFFVSTALGYGIGEFPWAYPGTMSNVSVNGTTMDVVIPNVHMIEQYLNCMHWSTQMLTTIGEVNAPDVAIEYIYATVSLLFGVLLFATLVGNVGTIITNLNAARTRFESRLDNVKQYMHNRNINTELKESVLRWFDHLWEKSRGIDEQETLQNLPNKLRARIAISANRKILESNPIYQAGDEGFKIDLMLRFRSELFPPNEIIYEKGHIGNEMYIIRSGRVELSQREKGQQQFGIESGEYFGMNCVINFNEFGRERSETAKTDGFCDLLVLEKKDLLELLIDYPNVKVKLDQLFFKEFKIDRPRGSVDTCNINKFMNELSEAYTDLQAQYQLLNHEHNRILACYQRASTYLTSN